MFYSLQTLCNGNTVYASHGSRSPDAYPGCSDYRQQHCKTLLKKYTWKNVYPKYSELMTSVNETVKNANWSLFKKDKKNFHLRNQLSYV